MKNLVLLLVLNIISYNYAQVEIGNNMPENSTLENTAIVNSKGVSHLQGVHYCNIAN